MYQTNKMHTHKNKNPNQICQNKITEKKAKEKYEKQPGGRESTQGRVKS